MQKLNKVVYIREEECIGCTKCIQCCPFDAIIGASKLMHTVITDECIGCELCLPVCPVDCIDLVTHDPLSEIASREKIQHARKRHQARRSRLGEEENLSATHNSILDRRRYIAEAILRHKSKK